ncbi:MAG: hypothetical protein WCJ54_08490, partial [Actinomycetota bacterium]
TLFIIGGCLIAFIVILFLGIYLTNRQGKAEVVAKVGGQAITKPMVDQELSAFNSLVLVTPVARDIATKYMVDCRIAFLEGEKNNLSVSDEEVTASIKLVLGDVYNDYSEQQQQVTRDHIKCELIKQKVQDKEVTSVNGKYLALNILNSSDAKKTEEAAKKIADDLSSGTTTYLAAKTALEGDPVYGTVALKKYNPVISGNFDKYLFQNNMGIFGDSGLKSDVLGSLSGEKNKEKDANVAAIAAKQTLNKTPASSMDRWVVVQATDYLSSEYLSIEEFQKAKYKEYKATYKSSETNTNVNLAEENYSINTDQSNWFDKNTYYVKLGYLDKSGVAQPIALKPSIKESIYVTDSLEVKKSNNFTPIGNGYYMTQEGVKTPTMIALLNTIDPSVAENYPDDTFVKDGYWKWVRKDGSSEKEVKMGNETYDTANLNELKSNGVTTANEFLWVPKYQIVPMVSLIGPSSDALVRPESVSLIAQVTNTELEAQTKIKFRYRLASDTLWQESPEGEPRFFGDNRVNREYNIKNLESGEKYEWQAKAIDQKGVESDWTLANSFYTLKDKQLE